MKKVILLIVLLVGTTFSTRSQILTNIDVISDFNEGLAAVKQGDSWGFINTEGTLVIEYRNDIVASKKQQPAFNNGMCLIKKVKDNVVFYGYINTKGSTIIEPQYIMASPFKDGYAVAVKHGKRDTGNTNALGKRIVFYSYDEILIDTKNERVKNIRGPVNLIFENLKNQKKVPVLTSFIINENLVAVRDKKGRYSMHLIE